MCCKKWVGGEWLFASDMVMMMISSLREHVHLKTVLEC